jgi:hypothetical protein
MLREVGNKSFPIWLLGDSNPKEWEDRLKTPFDPRHSARHNIWTSIADVVQERVFRAGRRRIDTSALYIRNAIEKAKDKPRGRDVDWPDDVNAEVLALSLLLKEHKPVFLFTFGAFSYEFARRALGQEPKRRFDYWGAKTLGQAFRERLAFFDVLAINVFPLLHISISAGKFLASHNQFCERVEANYFEDVASELARIILAHADALPVWIV